MTLFERVTKSPKALAEFIDEVVDDCTKSYCKACPLNANCLCDKDSIEKVLKKEINGSGDKKE